MACSEKVRLQRCLQNRSSSSSCLSGSTEAKKTFPFSQDKVVKSWSSLDNLDGQDIKAECLRTNRSPSLQQSVNINVGGKVFQIPKQSVVKYPNTRIGLLALCKDQTKLLTLCDDYSVSKNEFFFDRDPAFIHYICHFYTSGVLWIVQEMCPINFEEEIAYWGLSLKDTKLCCWMLFEEKLDEVRDNLKMDGEVMAAMEVKYDHECFKDMIFGNVRNSLWNIVENPYSSTLAKAVTVLSNFFVLLSIAAMTLNTVEELQSYRINNKTYMEWVEVITIVFFTFEYSTRLISTPNIKMFLKSVFNFVDMVSVMPYFIQIICEAFTNAEDLKAQEDLRAMTRVSKVSISTVGYGDVVPVTVLGRIVAFGCISFGIVFNSMPISMLFNKFSEYYNKLKAQESDAPSACHRFQLKKRLRNRKYVCFRTCF
ncbi:potassium voltage-gated channel subfamily V member 2-like isoform X2 [Odontesthes bonariensis]|uniref:potassium voltage-gated channel subfamily V member 2-like isoform X2 n=1 Tax=Odontesthes bonariensis TaxID=219752 RepID=UPI003F5889AA